MKKWSDELKERVVQMRHQGLTFKEIAAHIGNITDHQACDIYRARNGRNLHASKTWRDPRYVPEPVLADRERRLNADLTANNIILGDPVVPRWKSNV